MKPASLLLLGSFILSWGGASTVFSQGVTPEAAHVLSEAEGKAALVLNFARFTKWPEGELPQDNKTIRIGVTGESPVADELERLSKGFLIQGHPVVIAILEGPLDATQCQVIFMVNVNRGQFSRYLEKRDGQAVLIVGDRPEMAGWGASVVFQRTKTRLQFVVNRKAARSHHLTFSSQLLKLAAKILD
jgi:hypothetical protein